MPGVVLDHDAALSGRGDVADEPLADLPPVGVRVADAVGAHDDDEVGARLQPDALGVGLQGRRRVRRLHGVDDVGRGRHGLGHRRRPCRGLRGRRALRLQVGPEQARPDHQGRHQHLQGERLPGDAPPRGRREPVPHATPR